MTHSRPAIRRLLDEHGLAPRRELGQNFVVDPNTVRKIASLARVGPGDGVIEVGAGLGSLTLALAETGARIVAVEVDAGLVAVLRSATAELPNVRVVHADAMHVDWRELTGVAVPADGTWVLVANLPYNVATPLVCDVLDTVPQISRLVVMVQREVAERFAARPRTPAYGAVSVKVAFWGRARILADVPATVFLPRPNVESAIVEIERHDVGADDRANAGALFELVRRAFGQRRKMLRRSLGDLVDPTTFERAAVEPTSRPEELDVDAWRRLADAHRCSPSSDRQDATG